MVRSAPLPLGPPSDERPGTPRLTAARRQHNYFLANTTTIADVIDDTRPVGVSHGPAGCFRGYNGNTGESKLRYCGVYQTLAPEFWNMYFEQTGVDMIITPTQFTPIQK